MPRLLAVATLLPALAVPAAAQKVEDLVGVERLRPGLVPPMVLERIVDPDGPYRARPLVDLKLQFHESVPAEVWLEKGKRETLFTISARPPMKRTWFITPGLLNLDLEYDKKHKREHRWEIKEAQGGQLIMYSHSGSLLRLRRGEICFLDLNHDGAFGGLQDGYVIRERRTSQWVKPGKDLKVYSMEDPWTVRDGEVWFDVDTAGFSVVVTSKKPDFSLERRKEYQKGLEYLNDLRKQLGYEPVSLDTSLLEACEKHCLYCALNGVTHDEEKGMPGYTPEGAKAGKNSELTPARGMTDAIRKFSSGFFHRIRMLSPTLDKVGMGLVNGHAALDTATHYRTREFAPYAWPCDGAKDVPVTWLSGENPHPLGREGPFLLEEARGYGYPITLTFPSANVVDVKVKLETEDGKGLDLEVRSPENPAAKGFPTNCNSLFIMSKGQLAAKTTYTVKVDCSFDGKPFHKEWSFTTR